MKKVVIKRAVICLGMLLSVLSALAQEGTYSGYTPYSMYAIGDMLMQGSAYNKSMGGVGIATRNNKYINYLNPASITARDSLSFMADFSVANNNSYFSQGDRRSVNNRFNLNNLAITFPIYKSTAAIVGIAPMSATGYNITSEIDTPEIISEVKSINDEWSGIGSIYQAFFGVATTIKRRVSIGAEFIQYFGQIDKSYDRTLGNSSYLGFSSGQNLYLKGIAGKFGVQYEQPLGGGFALGVGATYRTRSRISGEITSYVDTISVADTLNLTTSSLTFADEVGLGISLRRNEKWRVELNYVRSDWSKSGFDDIVGLKVGAQGGASFSATAKELWCAGFEIVPNANDVRYYYRRWAYRAGVHYGKSYFKFDGNQVEDIGVTLGVTLPVFRWSNGVTIAFDFGQRGSSATNMIKERYANITVGFNAYDIWFQKSRYK